MMFKLDDQFVKEYNSITPKWGFNGLGYVVFKRTYARDLCAECHNYEIDYDDSFNKSCAGCKSTNIRTEEWAETCRRVVEGTFSIQKKYCKSNRLFWDEPKAQKTAQDMFDRMFTFKFLPPGRGLWAMGTKNVDRSGACLNNCAFISTENLSSLPFKFLMDMSMLGVGVGFDTKGAGYKVRNPKNSYVTHQIPDTREGWVESLGIIIDAFLYGEPLPIFFYDSIRKKGSPIKTFGGTASGPEPLIEMHNSIIAVLRSRVDQELQSTDIVDIMNFIGKCVVAGNVRRSSEIALGDAHDIEFVQMKQDKEKLISHRWGSNNSVFASVGMDYAELAKHAAVNGEPGFFWLANAQAYGRMKDAPNHKDDLASGTNPCSEQTLFSGETCCLVETFPAKHNDLQDYLKTLKVAYLYAKTVTLVPTHWEFTNSIISRNRRIGCSMSGIVNAFAKIGRRKFFEWCDKGYAEIQRLDKIYSDWFGVARSIKTTSVKPSGTVSLLAGEAPGIHYPHSKYYIRRMRISNISPLVEWAKNCGLKVNPAIGQERDTSVIEFPVCEENFERSKYDVSIWEQVTNAVKLQKYWADNQVSITVTVKKDEEKDIEHVLESFEDSLKSISFLPLETHGYVQAPYETITQDEYFELMKNVNITDSISTINRVDKQFDKFCDGEKCTI